MTEDEKRIRQLMVATNMVDGSYAGLAKQMGVKENTLVLLYALMDGEEHSQIEISREWLMPKTTLNTILNECVEQGLVLRISRQHTKEKGIRLTEPGKEYAARILGRVHEAELHAWKNTLAQYSPSFVEAFAAFAKHLSREMQKQFAEKTG